ncbi:MAG: DUF2877 domain-containing protein [Elusimicrobiota bacterium]|nr:DUF2877 domain-containing protein [Elusimicrobiota bacterium]
MRAKALYYDDALKPCCLQNIRLIKRYKNSCYFRNSADEFITFLKAPNQLVPGGIGFPESEYARVSVEDRFSLELISGKARSLQLPESYGISFEAAAIVQDRWHSAKDDFKNILDLLIARRNWKKLLGLGSGLTPSGDDFLVGYIAAKKMEGMEIPFKLKVSGTTSLSAHFLKNALQGRFSDKITGFIKEGDLSILFFGGSSGAATAFGIIKGMEENECLRLGAGFGSSRNTHKINGTEVAL